MGIILSILSYVTKIFTNLMAVKQKATNPSYNADTDSNEAISENVASIRNNTFSVERDSHSGSVNTATYEQWLYQDAGSAGHPFNFCGGIVDLSNLQAGDKVTVKLWACLYSGDSYRVIGQVKVAGPLTLNSKLEFGSMYNIYGVKVGIIQNAGSSRSVQHEWFDAKQLAV